MARGRWNGGEWPGAQAAGSTLLFSHSLSNAEKIWVVAYQRHFDEDEWIRHYQIAPHPIDTREIFFATHRTRGHGTYVEAPIPRTGIT